MNKAKIYALVGVLACLAVSGPALAADKFPSEVVKLVVPYPPGGPTDALARRLAQGAGKKLGTTIVVENKAGANGNIGAEYVARAKPDGYTIMFGTSGPLAINTSMYKKLGYQPETSFTPIMKIGHLPNILVVNPKVPVKNVQELIAYAKANPDKVTYASSGTGASSHLAGVLFNTMAGTRILHVPYKGTGPALNDLLGGQVSMAFTDVLTALPHIREHKLNALGLAAGQRSKALPDLPTIAQQGLDGYDVSVFFGIVGPSGMSDQVVASLNDAFKSAMAEPDIQATLGSQGIVQAEKKTPEELARFIHSEVKKWHDVITNASIKLD